MEISSPEEFFSSLHKRQIYLMLRIPLIVLLYFFGFLPILNTPNITYGLLINTIILFVAPLFLEYSLSFDTYSNGTNTIRWIGIFVSGIILVFAFFGYMSLGLSEKILNLNLNIRLILQYIMPSFIVLSIADFLFSLHPREIIYYKINSKTVELIKNDMKTAKRKMSFEKRVNKFKEEIINEIRSAR